MIKFRFSINAKKNWPNIPLSFKNDYLKVTKSQKQFFELSILPKKLTKDLKKLY